MNKPDTSYSLFLAEMASTDSIERMNKRQVKRSKTRNFAIFRRIALLSTTLMLYSLRFFFIFVFIFTSRRKIPLHRFTISHRSVVHCPNSYLYIHMEMYHTVENMQYHWQYNKGCISHSAIYAKSILYWIGYHNTIAKRNQCDSYSLAWDQDFNNKPTEMPKNKTHTKKKRRALYIYKTS